MSSLGEVLESVVEKRRPVQEGDIDYATWWVRITDANNPIAGECR